VRGGGGGFDPGDPGGKKGPNIGGENRKGGKRVGKKHRTRGGKESISTGMERKKKAGKQEKEAKKGKQKIVQTRGGKGKLRKPYVGNTLAKKMEDRGEQAIHIKDAFFWGGRARGTNEHWWGGEGKAHKRVATRKQNGKGTLCPVGRRTWGQLGGENPKIQGI